jgi:predicted DNA-binding transcriptional regulator AlpA
MHRLLRDYETGDDNPLLLTANQAARLPGVSRKTLWNHTAPRGAKIPAVRIGKVVRYRRDSLERWITEHEKSRDEEATR